MRVVRPMLCTVLLFACACSQPSDDPDLAVAPDLATVDLWGTGPLDFGGDAAIASAAPNVVPLIVNSGPTGDALNTPYVSVTLCAPGTTMCQTVDDIQVDTGSIGFHVLASAVDASLLALLPIAQQGGVDVTECYAYAVGSLYGSVRTADFVMGGETATAMPLLVAGDAAFTANLPASCAMYGAPITTTAALYANGVLGLGLFTNDCGDRCTSPYDPANPTNPTYYTCPSSGACSPVVMPQASQLPNPITRFAGDNNGLLMELPAIPSTGAASVTGALVFGVGTRDNNRIEGESVYRANTQFAGEVVTHFEGTTYPMSFFDCGSGYLLFSSGLPACSGSLSSFYCPATTQSFGVVFTGTDGKTGTGRFQVGNGATLLGQDPASAALSDIAIFDVGGLGQGYFDWGLPFFYGHRMFSVLDGATTPYGTGPYYAF